MQQQEPLNPEAFCKTFCIEQLYNRSLEAFDLFVVQGNALKSGF